MTSPVDLVVAVHHPLRRRLVEVLGLEGPATASRLAERTDQLVGNISHHLKVLARAGLVEEAPELARDRRERWWREVPRSITWSITDAMGDPAAETVLAAAEQQNLAHQVGKVQDWYAQRESHDPAWLDAAFSTDAWIDVTPTELAELGAQITALLRPYAVDRGRTTRAEERHEEEGRGGEGATIPRERVFVFARGVPGRP